MHMKASIDFQTKSPKLFQQQQQKCDSEWKIRKLVWNMDMGGKTILLYCWQALNWCIQLLLYMDESGFVQSITIHFISMIKYLERIYLACLSYV